ncbi:MAG: TetR family transcriptional regulator [Acidobacteria bacterium]|nr:TetR family transcriptional regulator [Acidobacteriota bacterium]
MPQRSEDARASIVAAAWRLADRRDVSQILAGVSFRDVARELGMSASTISYHFSGPSDLAWAMLDALVDDIDLEPLRVLTEVLRAEDVPSDVASLVRAATQADWEVLATEESAAFERRLMRALAATGGHEDGDRIAARLRERIWGRYLAALTDLIEVICDRSGRHFAEPVTPYEMARMSTAMVERLLHQWMVDPDGVRDDLAADGMVALYSALLRPDHQRVHVDELEASMRRRDEADPEVAERLQWARQVGVASAGLFSRPPLEVSLTEIAEVAGVSVRAVGERFRSPVEVAAVSTYRHLAALSAAFDRRVEIDVELGLVDALSELVRLVRAEPNTWGSLAIERPRSVFRGATDGIHLAVPLDTIVETSVEAMGLGLSEGERVDLSRLVVDTVLSYSLTRPAAAPAAVAELALRLLPDRHADPLAPGHGSG